MQVSFMPRPFVLSGVCAFPAAYTVLTETFLLATTKDTEADTRDFTSSRSGSKVSLALSNPQPNGQGIKTVAR
jgi:hypothetical protein